MTNKNILILILYSFLYSQPLEEIRISGNKITKEEIILREIHHPLNYEFSDSIRVEDENRLYNLGIFSSVEIIQIGESYLINLVEIPQYYPLPLLDFDESKGKEGTSYGIALRILNLNGKNRNLELGGMYGNQNIYFVRLSDPWIFGDHISLNISL